MLMRKLASVAQHSMRNAAAVILPLAGALFVSASTALATTQAWTAGWDNFSEPLDFTHSNITWSVSSTTRKLTVTFRLVGARPSKLYQVGVHIININIIGLKAAQAPLQGLHHGRHSGVVPRERLRRQEDGVAFAA